MSFHFRQFSRLILAFVIGLQMLTAAAAVAQRPPASTSKKKAANTSTTEQASASKKTTASTRGKDEMIVAIIREVSPQQVQQTIEKLVSFGTRNTLSVNNPEASMANKGIVAAREWIKSEFKRYSDACGGCLDVKVDDFVAQPGPATPRVTQPTQIENIYAILRGTDPSLQNRIYLVTGHYDSRNKDVMNTTDPAPGANDDASGTAVSLECARVLSKHRFPSTIIFLAVAGEEQGLLGSAHFAKRVKELGLDAEAVLNNDIVGGNRTPGDTLQNPNWVRVFSEGIPAAMSDADLKSVRATGGENDSTSRELARFIAEVGRTYTSFGQFSPKLIFRRDRYLRGGDHSSFNDKGIAAVRFTEYREDFHHQHENPRTEKGIEYGDLPKFVDFNYVANVARLNAATLAALALSPAPPAKPRLLTKELENDSKIEWGPANGAVAYEVLWRKTSDPDFPEENVTRVGSTKADLPESKDNVIFGVRSVDAKGHRSMIVIPEPER